MTALSSRAIQDFDSFLEMGKWIRLSLSETSEGEGKVEAAQAQPLAMNAAQ